MNWVQRRAKTEQVLRTQAPEIWSQVRAALQDACESWREAYSQPNSGELEDKMENGARFRVKRLFRSDGVRRFQDLTDGVLVTFDKDKVYITAVRDQGNSSAEYRIASDENEAFLTRAGGPRISIDDVSREILEPLLFPVYP